MPGVLFYGDTTASTKFLDAVADLPQTTFIFSTAPSCFRYLAASGRTSHHEPLHKFIGVGRLGKAVDVEHVAVLKV